MNINTNYISNAIRDVKKYLNIEDYDISMIKCDAEGFTLKRQNNKYIITYSDKSDLTKALGLISIYGDKITEISQKKIINKLGYLIDTARNAVPTVDVLKKQLIRLSLFGYNRVYLYVEDVMEIENEPFYGHLRGRYTEAEFKEIDAYASELGIEVVPCIQTLAHLNCIFKWPEYSVCNDNTDILLVENDRTYQLIDNILMTLSRCFSTKHIHIGMDEAYLVGCGKYMDLHGYKSRYELLKYHIERVMEISQKYGYSVEIWSDMYFRESFGGDYYSETKMISEEVCSQIPKDVGLVYWDYYNRDENLIENMFQNHIKTGNDVAFAGGAWKWSGWNPSTRMALVVGRKMLDAALRHTVQSVFITAWSDDGAESSIFNTLPSIILYSLYAYGEETDDGKIDYILSKLTGISLEDYCTADLDFFANSEVEESYLFGVLPKILMYNDPLSGFYDGALKTHSITNQIKRCKNALLSVANNCYSYEKQSFELLHLLCNILEIKWDLGIRIRQAYQNQENLTLSKIAEYDIPELISRIQIFKAAFFKMWMSENKTNGFQTHDLRLGGLVERLNTVKILINAYLAKNIDSISELEEQLVDIEEKSALEMLKWSTWSRIHSVYVV